MKKKRSLIGIIQLSICLLMSLSVISIGSLWLNERIKHSKTHKEDIREHYLTSRKDDIKKEVEHVSKYIEHKRAELKSRIRTEVQQRTEEAHQIAQYIYEQNKDSLTLAEIGQLIHDALYAASWNDGEGYYFAEDMAGVERVNRNNPELEGQSILNLQDGNGKYLVKEILDVARSEEKEGFCTYYWNRLKYPGKLVPKISYVKYFQPLDWVIGNGIYLNDEENRIKREVLKSIENISLSNERYIFVGTFAGVVLAGPGKGENMWDVSDANDLKVVQELIERAQKGGGFVHYVMPKFKGQRADPKISYATSVPGWDWYIGTGVYIDSLEGEIARQQKDMNNSIREISIQVLLLLGLFLLVSNLLVWLFVKKIETNFDLFVDFFKKYAFEKRTIPPEKVSFREFQSLALVANQMVEDRQNVEQAKEESEERFRRILENITDVYFETSLDGSVFYCSPSCLEFSGYSQKELIGKNSGILYNDPNDRKLLLTPLQKKGKVRNLELLFLKKNGDLYDVSLSAELAFDKEGNPSKIKGTIRDVTSINKAKEQLQRSKKMEVIGLMAGGVAHDLNNILSGIIGYPELLLQTLPEDSDLRKPIEAIHESGQRAATVVADLLTVARGAASVREAHNLNALIEEYLHSPECKNLRVLHPTITCHSQFNATHPTIFCSSVHVKKCLMNLVINAAEAMADNGSVTVSTHNKSVDDAISLKHGIKAGEYVVLSVRDTGPGISDIDLTHIFEPFYTKKTMGRSGTGLGLAVVWNTMEDHDGKVLVESNNKGTDFHLYFPLSLDEECVQPEDDKTVAVTNNTAHILVVDDEPQLRDIASQMLQSFGYTVDSVSSGELAVEFVKEGPVDLIVLDMLMEPGMNGCQTYEEILKLYPNQKAIVASGFSESDDVKATLKRGAGGFIKKPYSMAKLGQVVEEALNS